MEKNYSKHFTFMGFDINLSAAKKEEEPKKEEEKKMEEKKVSNENTKENDNLVGLTLAMLSGYGAFKFVRGLAKAVTKTSTPLGVASLLIFEGACALYSASKTYDACNQFKSAAEQAKKTIKHYNDTVHFTDDDKETES